MRRSTQSSHIKYVFLFFCFHCNITYDIFDLGTFDLTKKNVYYKISFTVFLLSEIVTVLKPGVTRAIVK